MGNTDEAMVALTLEEYCNRVYPDEIAEVSINEIKAYTAEEIAATDAFGTGW